MYSFWTIALVWCDPEVVARRLLRFEKRSGNVSWRNNTKEIRLRAYSRSPGRSCRPFFLANANSAWCSIAPFPRSIESTLSRLRRVPTIFAESPRKSLLYSVGGTLPGKTRPRQTDTAARSGLFVFSPASVSSSFFSPRNNLTFFFVPYADSGSIDIFARILIHGFPKGNRRFTEQSTRKCFFVRSARSPRVFPKRKTAQIFQTGSILSFE